MDVIVACPEPGEETNNSTVERFGRLLTGAFPVDAAPARPMRRLVAAAWVVAAVIAGAAASLGRTRGGPGVLETIWAEDGTYFYSDALGRPALSTIVRPLAGYYLTAARLLAVPSRFVPLEWGPAVLSVEAAIVTALLAVVVYLASGAHVRTTVGRLVVAAPLVVTPVGENLLSTTANDVAPMQFILIYTALWVLLWRPARRWQQILAFAVVLLAALSTLLVALLLPVAVLRLFVRRDWLGRAMAGALGLGVVLNVMALSLGLTERPAFLVPRYDTLWALRGLIEFALPNAVFGYRFNNGRAPIYGHAGLVLTAAVVVLVAVVVAAWLLGRRQLLEPQWTVAAIMVVEAVILFCGAVMSAGRLELRYVIAPQLMVIAAAAVLLRPASRSGTTDRARWVPTAALAAFILLVCVASYQMTSSRTLQAHSWRSLVAQARLVCQDPRWGAVYVYPSSHGAIVGIPAGTPMADLPPVGWPVRLPCDRLRPS